MTIFGKLYQFLKQKITTQNVYKERVVINLETLGREYLTAAQNLTDRIHMLNKKSTTLSGNDKILIKRRIASLYYDAAECRNIAKKLITYHERNNKLWNQTTDE